MMRQPLKIRVQPDAVNEAFRPYLRTRARFCLSWGGRDSSKSDFWALKLLLDCLELPYFKCVLVRDVFNTIGGSQVATLKKVAEREGIDHLFVWGQSPLGIKCLLNGNSFVPHGMDNPGKLKSLSDPTHAWYEEANQIAKADAEVLSTSLRSSAPGSYLQEIYTFNPDHQGDYKEFWLWQKFFRDTGHPDGLSFSGRLSIDVNGQLIEMPYEVLHTTANDNAWCPPERKALYRSFEATDPYRYRVWWLGLWATKETGNEFYHKFSRTQHVKPTEYRPDLPLYTSWDANSLPYAGMLCFQLDRQPGQLTVRFFKEYTIGPPESGVRPTARQFLLDRKAHDWDRSPLFCTGDASMRNRKPGEGNATLYKDIEAELNLGRALSGMSMDFWPKQNANVDRRRDFLNKLFSGFYPDVRVQIDPGCPKLVQDLEQVQKGIEGKLKTRVMDKELGVAYEPIGHLSDCFDYGVLTVLPDRWSTFVKGYK